MQATRRPQMVRDLHAAGHHIIIHTARRMRTHSGNVSAVVADVGHITIESLKRFGIPYDEVRASSWTNNPCVQQCMAYTWA